MKTASELRDIAAKAIRANFAQRNTSVFVGMPSHHARVQADRRRQIREWVGVLRIARNQQYAIAIEQVTNVGPLMAHDLRRRVLSLV